MLKRLPGLDGLRGIAVIAVVLYHADLGILNGGFLGVDIFFVLSGFLITNLLLTEIAHSGTINRSAFYKRRVRRLIPALIAMIVVSVVISGLWVPDAAFGVRRDLPWALTFVLNWSYILVTQSYFVHIARPPLFQHLWSLAIEEQFYLVWPLVLIALRKISRVSLRQSIFVTSLIGVIASTWWMSIVSYRGGFPVPNDPSRAYFGSDTHAMGLLVGCLLASMRDVHKLNPKLTPDRRTTLNLVAVGSLCGIGYFLSNVSELTPFLYHGGFLALSALTAVVIVIAVHPGLPWARVIGNRILRWFGDRSYGMYIWHWPLFNLLRPGIDVAWPDVVTQVVRLALLLAVSDLSYRYIELPIRHGFVQKKIESWKLLGRPQLSIRSSGLALSFSAILIAGLIGVAKAPTPDASILAGLDGITSIDEDPTPPPIPTELLIEQPGPKASVAPVRHGTIVVFGDSVVLSGRVGLKEVLGPISIDAAVSRSPGVIAQHVKARRDQDRLGTDVVIHMGTNGLVRRQDLEPILESLRDRRRVVVVNTQMPRSWMKPTNAMIDSIVVNFPNVRLADWAATSKGHKDYFVPDGVHLTPTGGRAFAAMVKRALDGF